MRQWEKDFRSKYIALVENKEKLTKSLKNKEEQIIEESGWRKEDSMLKRQREDKRQLMIQIGIQARGVMIHVPFDLIWLSKISFKLRQ